MLAAFRKNLKTWSKIALWPVIIAFIATIFLVWGRGSGGPLREDLAAEVNGWEISNGQYYQAPEQLRRMYENLYRQFPGQAPDEEMIREAALRNVIDETILLQYAMELGLVVTDAELTQRIMNEPAFQRDGRFDRAMYMTVLQAQRMTAAAFEDQMRRDMLTQQVRDLIRQTAKVTTAEVEEELRRSSEKLTCDAVVVDAAKMGTEVAVSDEEIASYYEEHKEEFRRPEQIKLRYIQVRPEDFLGEVVISEEEIAKYYEENEDEFMDEEKVRARHILLRAPEKEDDEEGWAAVEKRAQEIREEILAGKDFAEAAKEYSQDPSNAQSGGDLGWFGRGRMVKAFEDAAFSLEVGVVSEPVRTRFGYHLIKVEERKEPGVKPLDEVRGIIEAKLRKERAERMADLAMDELYQKFLKDPHFESIVKGTLFTVKETKYFDFDKTPVEFGRSKEVEDYLKSIDDEPISDIIATDEGDFLAEFAERRPSQVPPLEEIRDEVRAVIEKEKLREEGKRLAEQLLAKVQELSAAEQASGSGEGSETEEAAAPVDPLVAAAQAFGLEVVEAGPFTRQSSYVPKVGPARDLVKDAFRAPIGAIRGPVSAGEKWVVYRVKEKTELAPEERAKRFASTRASLLKR